MFKGRLLGKLKIRWSLKRDIICQISLRTKEIIHISRIITLQLAAAAAWQPEMLTLVHRPNDGFKIPCQLRERRIIPWFILTERLVENLQIWGWLTPLDKIKFSPRIQFFKFMSLILMKVEKPYERKVEKSMFHPWTCLILWLIDKLILK